MTDRIKEASVEPITPVAFRLIGDEVIALFPEDIESMCRGSKLIGSYMHVGQHSSAAYELIAELPTATPEQYADLKAELEAEPYGYRFEVLP